MPDTYKPTAEIASAAKRAIKWIEEGHAGSGFTATGRTRASQLANREAVSLETVKRMYSFFSRHEVDKKGQDFDNLSKPSAGRVAWDAWGGDAGFSWARKIVDSMSEKSVVAMHASVFAPILKSEKQTDGSLLVVGLATDDSIDSDNQICDPTWLGKAMPEWFAWGNIREQHSNIAAGVATEYEAIGSRHMITARVVDPASVKKVEAGVLKGFSVGIRNARVIKDDKAAGGRIIDGQIVEVSLVDRPANPLCTLTVAKSIGNELTQVEELSEMENQMTDEIIEPTQVIKAIGEESTEESTGSEMTDEESTAAKAAEESMKMCKECGKAEDDCKCAEGGYSATTETKAADEETMKMCKECGQPMKAVATKAPEESSQAIGEESSQEIGEESSREGGVAGVAGKSLEAISDQLIAVEKSITVLTETYTELLKSISTTEDIAKSVQEVAERVSVVEKAPAAGAMRMAVKPQVVDTAQIDKAADYRAKAMSATDPMLQKGFLSLALEIESNL
jgi:hypothetical protein